MTRLAPHAAALAAALFLAALPAQAQSYRCADLALTLDVNTGGGMRTVTAIVRNDSANPLPAGLPGSIRADWQGPNAAIQDFPLTVGIAPGAQVTQILGMWPVEWQGTLSVRLGFGRGVRPDCNDANNIARLAL